MKKIQTFLTILKTFDRGLLTKSQFEELRDELFSKPSDPMPAPAPQAPTTTTPDEKTDLFTVDGVSFEMIGIKAGSFQMGSPYDDSEARDNEKPQHTVRLSRAFQLGKVPVTQELWQAVMGSNPSRFKGDDQHPVEQVSWFDSVRFCNKLSEKCGLKPAYTIGSGDEPEVSWDSSSDGFRLPTEAEWEYAGRAGEDTLYAGSNSIRAVAWYEGNAMEDYWSEPHAAREGTQVVAQLQPNAWGLYDMSGNVYEWVWDRHGDYQSGSSVDPVGPQSGTARVCRGGCWGFIPRFSRLDYRSRRSPGYRFLDLGLRVVRTIC